ncbi:hypothetical protein WJ08_25710 [Burkholderia vietnamiensis]|nr:hypothetical protein WJ08_25710 [Burkholderia vietnamiensis]KVF38870.1 hypothetical protein WJ10_01275 [Burkholderia vietnamiensis]
MVKVASAVLISVREAKVRKFWIGVLGRPLFLGRMRLLFWRTVRLLALRVRRLLFRLPFFFLRLLVALLYGEVEEVSSLIKYRRESIFQKWMSLRFLLNQRFNGGDFDIKLACHTLILGIRKELWLGVTQPRTKNTECYGTRLAGIHHFIVMLNRNLSLFLVRLWINSDFFIFLGKVLAHLALLSDLLRPCDVLTEFLNQSLDRHDLPFFNNRKIEILFKFVFRRQFSGGI